MKYIQYLYFTMAMLFIRPLGAKDVDSIGGFRFGDSPMNDLPYMGTGSSEMQGRLMRQEVIITNGFLKFDSARLFYFEGSNQLFKVTFNKEVEKWPKEKVSEFINEVVVFFKAEYNLTLRRKYEDHFILDSADGYVGGAIELREGSLMFNQRTKRLKMCRCVELSIQSTAYTPIITEEMRKRWEEKQSEQKKRQQERDAEVEVAGVKVTKSDLYLARIDLCEVPSIEQYLTQVSNVVGRFENDSVNLRHAPFGRKIEDVEDDCDWGIEDAVHFNRERNILQTRQFDKRPYRMTKDWAGWAYNVATNTRENLCYASALTGRVYRWEIVDVLAQSSASESDMKSWIEAIVQNMSQEGYGSFETIRFEGVTSNVLCHASSTNKDYELSININKCRGFKRISFGDDDIRDHIWIWTTLYDKQQLSCAKREYEAVKEIVCSVKVPDPTDIELAKKCKERMEKKEREKENIKSIIVKHLPWEPLSSNLTELAALSNVSVENLSFGGKIVDDEKYGLCEFNAKGLSRKIQSYLRCFSNDFINVGSFWTNARFSCKSRRMFWVSLSKDYCGSDKVMKFRTDLEKVLDVLEKGNGASLEEVKPYELSRLDGPRLPRAPRYCLIRDLFFGTDKNGNKRESCSRNCRTKLSNRINVEISAVTFYPKKPKEYISLRIILSSPDFMRLSELESDCISQKEPGL